MIDEDEPPFREWAAAHIADAKTPEERETRERRLAYVQNILAERSDALERIRRHAGLSVDELAKEMGFKGASGIQRYLSADYDKGFRPEIARAFRKAFLGKGTPPITDEDLLFLLREKAPEPGDPVWAHFEVTHRASQATANIQAKSLSGQNRIAASLPLVEGEASIEMPRFMSEKSLAALKAWLAHLSDFADSMQELNKGSPYKADKNDPTKGKRW